MSLLRLFLAFRNPAGRSCVVACGLFFALVASARAEHRRALLIGNGKYPKAELVSPPQDVRAVGAALERRGFVVTLAEDLTADRMRATFEEFTNGLPDRSTALVYFAGYALPNGKSDSPRAGNSLLPIDGNPLHEGTVGGSQTGVNELIGRMATHGGNAFTILIIDGCYAHPGQAPATPRGLIDFASVPPDSCILIAAPPREVVAAADEGLSTLARALCDKLESSRPLGEVLGSLVPPRQVFQTDAPTGNAPSPRATNDPAPVASLPGTLASPASSVVATPGALKPGTKAGDEWVNDIGMVFCWCPPGRFRMGSDAREAGRDDDEAPVDVQIPTGFWMSKYEFTRRDRFALTKQFGTYLSTGDHKFDPLNKSRWDAEGPPGLLAKLNERAPPGWQYALPSEAEWEYAARAGTTTAYSFGDDPALLARHGNFADRTLRESDSFGEISKNWKPDAKPFAGDRQTGLFTYAHETWSDGVVTMALVGSFPPNQWGLHDMHGNMAELTSTPYHVAREPLDKVDDRVGWVTKGGSWLSTYPTCRSAHRGKFTYRARENSTENFLGLRVVVKPR